MQCSAWVFKVPGRRNLYLAPYTVPREQINVDSMARAYRLRANTYQPELCGGDIRFTMYLEGSPKYVGTWPSTEIAFFCLACGNSIHEHLPQTVDELLAWMTDQVKGL